MICWPDTWPQNSNMFYRFLSECFKSIVPAMEKLSRDIRILVIATRNDHCKVILPWYEICNPSTDSASEASNIDVAKHEILAPATRNASFRTLFKSPTPANVFCNPHKLLCLPRILKCIEIPAPATRKALWTSKSGPKPWCFNGFDFQIAVARRRGANFGDFNFQKCSDHANF